MMILNPLTGETVEIAVPPRAPTSRLQEREDAKAARMAEKEAERAARWAALRRAELDARAL